MEISKKIEMNRTGISVSPQDSEKMMEGAHQPPPFSEASELELAQNRLRWMKESSGFGSLPSSHNESLRFLLDQLGERLAVARMSVRLYDAVIGKYHPVDHSGSDISLEKLIQFRDENYQHFLLLSYVIEEFRGDPTIQTPSADLAGIWMTGFQKAVLDFRTRFFESLESLLMVELIDHEGWDLLVQLTRSIKMDEVSVKFQNVFKETESHVNGIRSAVKNAILDRQKAQKKAA